MLHLTIHTKNTCMTWPIHLNRVQSDTLYIKQILQIPEVLCKQTTTKQKTTINIIN
jgi:hypothetical protein